MWVFWNHRYGPEDPMRSQRPAPPIEVTILRVADRFGGTIDGALRQLGYPPPTPRELRRTTLMVIDAASAEALLQRSEAALKAETAVEMTTDEGVWFKQLMRYGMGCPGCGGLPGEHHADGCPNDPGEPGPESE